MQLENFFLFKKVLQLKSNYNTPSFEYTEKIKVKLKLYDGCLNEGKQK